MKMFNPPHPGEVLKELWMDPENLSVTELAETLLVDRKTISRIVNGKSGISAEMALRLAKAFDTSEELWLSLQDAYDIWQVRQSGSIDLSKIKKYRFKNKS